MIAIIKKNAGPTKKVRLLQYDRKTGLSEAFVYEPDDGENRLDYDFQAHPIATREGGVTLRQLGADIQRGSLNSVTVKLADYQTFHTTDYGTDVMNFPDVMPSDRERKLVVAAPGDILVARIDRARIEALFLNNLGKVVTREQIQAAATDPVTKRTPENWHQRLSEVRTDSGYTILSWRDHHGNLDERTKTRRQLLRMARRRVALWVGRRSDRPRGRWHRQADGRPRQSAFAQSQH
jgi:hypothetical protein